MLNSSLSILVKNLRKSNKSVNCLFQMQIVSSTYLAQKWMEFIRGFFEDTKISARRGDIYTHEKAILLLVKFNIKRAIILGHANF